MVAVYKLNAKGLDTANTEARVAGVEGECSLSSSAIDSQRPTANCVGVRLRRYESLTVVIVLFAIEDIPAPVDLHYTGEGVKNWASLLSVEVERVSSRSYLVRKVKINCWKARNRSSHHVRAGYAIRREGSRGSHAA